MNKKIEDLNNKYRVLLTEVLPYELPLIMTNQQFYNNMQDKALAEWFYEYVKSDYYIPFNYYVRRNGGKKSRLLSIMHPYAQLDVVDFYQKFDEYMIYLCNISPFSLRHINKIAKCMFPAEETKEISDAEGEHIEIDKDITNYDETKYKSYFTYKDYDMSYKFHDSLEFLRLEQKFRHFRTLDIASCFYHIYTHSIAWAVKNKECAKKGIKDSNTFESIFDNLMQTMNYRETNGVLVGAEISRIFAEIIFQRIDLNVLEKLKKETSLSLHKDFEIKRYVDDHMVFATEEKTLDIIENIYKEKLEEYKLYLNTQKTESFERPFASNRTVAKVVLQEYFSNFQNEMKDKKEDTYHAINGRNDFKQYVSNFHKIAKQNEVSYDILNRYQLVLFKNFIVKKILPSFENNIENRDSNVLYNILEICFYIFSLDMSTTASYRICRIVEEVYNMSKYDINVKEEVKQIIEREAKRCLDIYMANMSAKDTNMEVMNLLLTLDGIIGTVFDKKYIEKLFGIEDCHYEHLNYFQICTLMQLIKNENEFIDIKTRLKNEVEQKFVNHKEDWKSYTELVLLFFDWQSCPYLMNIEKQSLIVKLGCSQKVRENVKKRNGWFFDWNGYGKLSEYLSKKEYHNIYE